MRSKPQPYLVGSTVYLLQQGIPLEGPNGSRKYGRVRVSTGITIDPKHWDEDLRMPSMMFSAIEQFRTQILISEACQKMTEAYEQCRLENDLRPERVKVMFQQMTVPMAKRALQAVAEKKVDATVVDILNAIEAPMIPATKAQNAAFRAKVEAFAEIIPMRKVDDAWRDRLFKYISENHALNGNSLWNQQRFFNRMLGFAAEQGIKFEAKKLRKYKFITGTSDWLDWDDIKRVIEFEPTGRKAARFQDTKSYVLIGALTSIRISDYRSFLSNIRTRTVGGIKIQASEFRCAKKPNPLICPPVLLPLADQLAKHGKPKPRSFDGIRVSMAEFIREVGIDKHLSPHGLRRSFISNALALEISPRLLCSVCTGHQIGGMEADLKVFSGYNQSTLSQDLSILCRRFRDTDERLTSGIRLL